MRVPPILRLAMPAACFAFTSLATVRADHPPAANRALSQSDDLVGELGTINFAVSGTDEAKARVVRGVKLLHHMMYENADRDFAAALAADPSCALACWGRAIAIVHPLWSEPTAAQMTSGWEFVQNGLAKSPRTERERGYLRAMEAYFKDGASRTELDRLQAASAVWSEVAEKHPDDLDAKCFAALFQLAPTRFLPKDGSYRAQVEAGRMLEEVLAKIPDHPGGHHYRIHAYDFPLLAGRALELCDDYGAIAPEVPHALHMPTHIFTRRGEWKQSIEFNLRSVEAARKLSEREGVTSHHYTHGLDYLAYAYLQRGQFRDADAVRRELMTNVGPFNVANLPASGFALSAVPARWALERHDWAAAARLEEKVPASFPWSEKHAPYYSIASFARALGAARSGQLDRAREGIARLEQLRDQIARTHRGTYWQSQAETQWLTVRAWVAHAEGKGDEAVALMRRAADLEAGTDKEAVTPGEVLPAGELLGDLLTELNRPAEALAAYEKMLESAPNRLNSLHGAARAAEKSGDAAKASRYYAQIVAVAAEADPDLPAVVAARAFLAAK